MNATMAIPHNVASAFVMIHSLPQAEIRQLRQHRHQHGSLTPFPS